MSHRVNERYRRRLGRLERIASLVILLFFLAGAAPFVYKMATTSLWNDEIYTIETFSSKGLWVSLTHYPAPNNHILFNALSSLIPGSGSVEPYRARLVSFLAFAAALVVLVGYLHRRGRDVEAALCAVVIFNYGFLRLILQARGYGLVALFTIVATLSAMEYLRAPSRRALLALAAATLLGTWAVPIFVLYSGTLILLVFLATRETRVFYAGLATAAAVGAVYLPVARDLLRHAQGYSEIWGRNYATFNSVSATIQVYLPLRGHTPAFLILAGTLLAPAWVADRRGAAGRAATVLSLSIVCFFAACLTMQTPLVRTTAFIVIPMAILGIGVLGDLLRRERLAPLRPWVACALAITVAVGTAMKIRSFRFVPLENWKGAAQAIELIFPDDLPLFCNFRLHQLKRYLREPVALAKKFDENAFRLGRQVYLETSKDVEHKAELRTSAGAHGLISIPQLYAREKLILFYPPPRSRVRSVAIDATVIDHGALTDRSRATGRPLGGHGPGRSSATLRAELEASTPLRSAVVLWGDCPRPEATRVFIVDADTGAATAAQGSRSFGDVLVVPLGDRPVDAIEIRAELVGEPACIDEIWAYPSTASR